MLAVKPSLGRIASVNYRQHPRYRGCIGHWMMVEGGGLTVYDLSGRGNSGTLTGLVWSTGQLGPRLNFASNRLDIPNESAFDLSQLSIVARIEHPNAWANFETVAVKPYDSVNCPFWFCRNGVDWSGFGLGFYNGSWQFANTGSDLPTAGVVDIAGTYNGATIALYVNGALSDTTVFAGPLPNNNLPISIGNSKNWFGGDNKNFNGFIYSVRIYNRALTPNEVMSLYADPFLEFERRRRYFFAPQVAGVNLVPRLMAQKYAMRRRAA